MTRGGALVTGGALRLGRAIALALAEKGYDIALHYHTSADAAIQLATEIKALGSACHLFGFNFLDADAASDWMTEIARKFPDCNLLINSASIFERASFMETDTDLFDRHLAINFKTPFFLSQAFARRFQEGHIINILDTKIATTSTEYFIYTLTKKALYELTRMAAKELGPKIRVNGIAPGLILPPPGKDASYLAKKATGLAVKKYGGPENIVSAILFLLENPFITGECIFVDGGEHLN